MRLTFQMLLLTVLSVACSNNDSEAPDEPDTALPSDTPPDLDPTIVGPHGGTLVLIPAGTFDMGCTAEQTDCRPDESPVMPVTLTHGHYIGETEVTQAEYQAVMESTPSYNGPCGGACPAENLTWSMAAAFANALSETEGLTSCYTCEGSGNSVECDVSMSPYACDGYRLPTEAEWEGAARCGEGFQYAGSDTVEEVAWDYDNSRNSTQPVATLAPNGCGLYDMSGNVAEWVQDWYGGEYYTDEGRTDPEGPSSGDARVFRGGGAGSFPSFVRVASRRANYPEDTSYFLGFRVAKTGY